MKTTRSKRFLTALMALMLMSIAFVPVVSAQPDVSAFEPPEASISDTETREAVMNIIDDIEASDLDPTQKTDLINEINSVIQCQPISNG